MWQYKIWDRQSKRDYWAHNYHRHRHRIALSKAKAINAACSTSMQHVSWTCRPSVSLSSSDVELLPKGRHQLGKNRWSRTSLCVHCACIHRIHHAHVTPNLEDMVLDGNFLTANTTERLHYKQEQLLISMAIDCEVVQDIIELILRAETYPELGWKLLWFARDCNSTRGVQRTDTENLYRPLKLSSKEKEWNTRAATGMCVKTTASHWPSDKIKTEPMTTRCRLHPQLRDVLTCSRHTNHVVSG